MLIAQTWGIAKDAIDCRTRSEHKMRADHHFVGALARLRKDGSLAGACTHAQMLISVLYCSVLQSSCLPEPRMCAVHVLLTSNMHQP